MRIEKKHKPSFHKANARYRGVTELSQYTNFVLESAHDLLLLGHVTTGNEATNTKGHEKEIRNNFVSIMSGDEGVAKANLFTASTLRKINRERTITVPSIPSWSKVNNCTITTTSDGYKLSSNGLLDPVGISTSLYVEPGDKIYIRLKAKSTSGAPDFSFGSNNKRQSPNLSGDTRKVSIGANQGFVTLDYVLRCNYAQTISLNINVHQKPGVLAAKDVTIKDVEIYYLDEKSIGVSSFDQGIKPAVNEVEERINSIR